VPLPLAQVKNGDKGFWKQKFHAANEKAQHALMRGPKNSPVAGRKEGRKGRRVEDCLFCFLVPNVFPSGSLSCSPKIFPITPQIYPICFAQSSTLMYIYKLKRWMEL
jgi:hypothetical protein